jgi:hypothetical protein
LNSQIEDLEAKKDKIKEKRSELSDIQQELLRR